MSLKSIASIILPILFIISSISFKELPKEVDKEVKKTFEINSYTYETLHITEELQNHTPSKIRPNNFFIIKVNANLEGYVYIDKAPSKTAQFDYLVILDKNRKIVNTKVLVYREEYGGEIGSSRWLRQFIGMSAGDSMSEVAAISGATISVRSMKMAVGNILKTIEILHENKNL